MWETSQGSLEVVVERLRAAKTDLTHVEAKAAVGRLPVSIWETVSAFSNDGGGVILLGLDEGANFAPAPGFDATSIRDAVAEGFRPRRAHEPDGPVTPRAQGTIEIDTIDGRPIVVVDVDELPPDQKPCFVSSKGKESGSFERVGDGDRRMSTYAVFLLSTSAQQPTDDLRPVDGATIDDLDPAQVARFVTRLRETRPRSVADLTDERDILTRHNVLSADRSTPTLAGLMSFGRYPQHFLPQLMISFAAYPGHDKADVRGDVRMLDRRIIEGSIPLMVDDAVSATLKNLQTRRVSRGAGAADEPEIPVDALREAIVNALAHRDYSEYATGDQVRIEVYPDRVEIANPGGIWGGRREVDLYDGSSRSRNRVLASLLTEVPFPDRSETVSENAGSGIPRMTGVMGRAGLLAPRFLPTITGMTVVLDRHGILGPDVEPWLQEVGASRLDRPERLALALVYRGFDLHDQLLRALLGVDTEEAKQTLRGLVIGGWLAFPKRPGDPYRPGALLAHHLDRGSTPLFEMTRMPTRPAGFAELSLDEKIIAMLEVVEEADIHDLALFIDSTPNAIRPRLRVLIDQGAVVPTAAPQSKNRRYRRPR
ncbi:ATP-binding protein [Homoserinibacter sp. GY 40078]|uniref:ATP-binding protein n=1 Tax=Homoserinibacter sp. GY 40078 TaxID=2603275 RepID=UPI0011C83CFF|nr:ATP-binding protein [Homoserinibacter sp. GY 40078]TXK18832.1 transcriptional regulator [Homoserinibacter sp. GY 40078]